MVNLGDISWIINLKWNLLIRLIYNELGKMLSRIYSDANKQLH